MHAQVAQEAAIDSCTGPTCRGGWWGRRRAAGCVAQHGCPAALAAAAAATACVELVCRQQGGDGPVRMKGALVRGQVAAKGVGGAEGIAARCAWHAPGGPCPLLLLCAAAATA